MSQKLFHGSFDFSKGNHIEVSVPVFLFEEDGLHYAYSPHLDITGYSHTEDEAQASFTVMLTEFLDYSIKKKTLWDELTALGWKVRSKRKPITPPDIELLARKDENLSEILNHKNYRTVRQQVNLPAYA